MTDKQDRDTTRDTIDWRPIDRADENLLRDLLAIRENMPIIQVLNDVLGGPIDDPNFAVWRAVDADAIRRLGLSDGVVDSGLYLDLDETTYGQIAERLGVAA